MPINIVCTIDNNYVQHCGVMIYSLIRNSKHRNFFFYIIHDNLKHKEERKLKVFLKKLGISFDFIAIDSIKLQSAYTSHHITIATYFRLFIPELISQSIDKILFLDSDIIIKHDISNLWEIDVSAYSHAAVQDPNISNDFKRNLGINENNLYFNAGVMLINLQKWRDLDITSKALQFMQDHSDKIVYWDQDVLNFLLQGKWLKIQSYWNAQQAFFKDCSDTELQITADEFQKTRFDPSLIHYTGGGVCKPWHYYCNHPLKGEYYKYVKKTPWKYFKPTERPPLSHSIFLKLKSLAKKIFIPILNFCKF